MSLRNHDRVSLFIVFIATLITLGLVFNLSPSDSRYVNIISIIGTTSSFFGLLIAYVQIRKIASNAVTYDETFNKTIDVIKKNETISIISRALNQIFLVKKFFDLNQIQNSRDNIQILLMDLTVLYNHGDLINDQTNIKKFIEFCSEFETNLLIDDLSTESEQLKEYLKSLNQIQAYLIRIQQEFSKPKQE